MVVGGIIVIVAVIVTTIDVPLVWATVWWCIKGKIKEISKTAQVMQAEEWQEKEKKWISRNIYTIQENKEIILFEKYMSCKP